MAFDVDIGQATRVGPRPRNEDFAAVARPAAYEVERGLVAVIADGVSGGGGGLEAAQTSVLAVVNDYHGTPDTWDTTVVLDRLIGSQNAWLTDHNRRRQGPRGEGAATGTTLAMTTLTALVLRGQGWTLAHVGDTRAWLVRGEGDAAQLTQDHAFEEEFQRSRLTRAIGLDDAVHVDFEQGELRIGDVFLLTTDGVHGVLERRRLRELALEGDAQAASEAIVEAAVAAGTRDNATALVLKVNALTGADLRDTIRHRRHLAPLRRLGPGEKVDGYEIVAPVADTGVHVLVRARHLESGAAVVLKTLHESRAGDGEERALLLHEAWLAARVATAMPPAGEAGFVRAHPTAPDASALYTVYDWQPGATLEALMTGGRRHAPADIAIAGLAFARALARLHRNGIVHRDLKPENLHLGDDGLWRVLDLGAALSGSDPVAMRHLHAGTPSYMNPEQWGLHGAEPRPADAASDLYALGVTLYRWLTGKLPYGDVEPYQAGRFRHDPKPPSRLRPEVPIWLDHVVLKAVALDPKRRFETAEEFALALERGASRPLAPAASTHLAGRDPAALWKVGFGASVLLNALLIYWLLYLPR